MGYIGSMRVTEALKAQLLREYAMDLDWSSAAKRVGISAGQLQRVRQDERFMALAHKSLEKHTESGGIGQAVEKFRRTQELLTKELEQGNMSVAGALIRSHEIEFRQHGLFEKDNGQKKQAVQINISFPDAKPEVVKGEVIDG